MKKILITLLMLTSIVLANDSCDIRKYDYTYRYGEKEYTCDNTVEKIKKYTWGDTLDLAKIVLDESQLELVYSYLGTKGADETNTYLLDERGVCLRVASDFVYDVFGVNVYWNDKNFYEISRSELRYGDLVYYNHGDGTAHIVVYLGDGLVLSGNSTMPFTEAEMAFNYNFKVAVLSTIDEVDDGWQTYYRVNTNDKTVYRSCEWNPNYYVWESVKGTKGC